mmetsp:Transcript_2941/g.11921  ORF Transcript_2941/g.11921 Transcript_2941/m.11921 type:complete len:343 (-) Transcript_2941:151-1179(-)
MLRLQIPVGARATSRLTLQAFERLTQVARERLRPVLDLLNRARPQGTTARLARLGERLHRHDRGSHILLRHRVGERQRRPGLLQQLAIVGVAPLVRLKALNEGVHLLQEVRAPLRVGRRGVLVQLAHAKELRDDGAEQVHAPRGDFMMVNEAVQLRLHLNQQVVHSLDVICDPEHPAVHELDVRAHLPLRVREAKDAVVHFLDLVGELPTQRDDRLLQMVDAAGDALLRNLEGRLAHPAQVLERHALGVRGRRPQPHHRKEEHHGAALAVRPGHYGHPGTALPLHRLAQQLHLQSEALQAQVIRGSGAPLETEGVREQRQKLPNKLRPAVRRYCGASRGSTC